MRGFIAKDFLSKRGRVVWCGGAACTGGRRRRREVHGGRAVVEASSQACYVPASSWPPPPTFVMAATDRCSACAHRPAVHEKGKGKWSSISRSRGKACIKQTNLFSSLLCKPCMHACVMDAGNGTRRVLADASAALVDVDVALLPR